jgi:hypothetical protein
MAPILPIATEVMGPLLPITAEVMASLLPIATSQQQQQASFNEEKNHQRQVNCLEERA